MSRLSAISNHTDSAPLLPPFYSYCTAPGCLFWGASFSFPSHAALTLLQHFAKAFCEQPAPRTCNVTQLLPSQQHLCPRVHPPVPVPHRQASHPMPTAPSPFPSGEGENSVLQNAGCFHGDAGCTASPAEGWCLHCVATSWLHSAKSGRWMESTKPARPHAGVRPLPPPQPPTACPVGGEPGAAASQVCTPKSHIAPGAAQLLPAPSHSWARSGATTAIGAVSRAFSLAVVNAQDMTPIFSFCL